MLKLENSIVAGTLSARRHGVDMMSWQRKDRKPWLFYIYAQADNAQHSLRHRWHTHLLSESILQSMA